MKNHLKITTTLVLLTLTSLLSRNANAQTLSRTRITVLNIDTKGLPLDATQMGNITRLELEKLDTFDVTDRYDVVSLVEKHQLDISKCYGKECLREAGRLIHSSYMFSGNAELYGQTIVITYRLLNVETGVVERTTVQEFLNLPLELQSMAAITIRKMFDRPNDAVHVGRLTRRFNYESSINNPKVSRLNLQGPRFGFVQLFGPQSETLKRDVANGGLNARSTMFIFGYQFEKQYLNEGNYQALFEFIPLLTGIDQQLVIPSFTFLNGFRNNVSGWEVALGPSVSFTTTAEVGKIGDQYYTRAELNNMGRADVKTKHQFDSRGDVSLTSALVIAFGRSYKSGKMNIPLNVYGTIPVNGDFRVGVAIGYNSKR
jgi:hypothetical protein